MDGTSSSTMEVLLLPMMERTPMEIPIDSSNTVANEYTISIPSTPVAVCAELNGSPDGFCLSFSLVVATAR